MRGSRGFTTVEVLIVLVVLAVLGTIGFVAYENFIKKAKHEALKAHLKEYGTAILAMYQDTGVLAGLDPNVPFPDSLFSTRNIADANVAQRWKGPYVKNQPVCPYANCTYDTDYNTGAAANVGDVYLYFVTATNVPLQDALEVAKAEDGEQRIANGECLSADIPNAVAGTSDPCKVYLSTNTGGPNTLVTVFYTFMTGRY